MSKRKRQEQDELDRGAEGAVVGLVDDRSERVADAVFAQVFASEWQCRKNLDDARRQAASKEAAAVASRAARAEHTVYVAIARTREQPAYAALVRYLDIREQLRTAPEASKDDLVAEAMALATKFDLVPPEYETP